MNSDVLTTTVADGIAVITLGKLCVSDIGLSRMRSYVEKKITSPNRSFEV